MAAAVAGSLVAGLVATGCSGRGAVADDRPPGDRVEASAALSAVHRAADVLIRSGSSRARTSMESANGGTKVVIRGEGGFDYQRRLGRLRVVLPKDAAGTEEHQPITELLTPGSLYMKNRGAGVPADKWVRVDTAELADGNLVTGGATDPLAAAELLRGAQKVSYLGDKRTGGVMTHHFRGTADISRAAKAASAQSRDALAAAAKGFPSGTVAFDAYLDDQGRLRKIRHRFLFSNGSGGPEDVMEVASTIVLYDFGAEVNIELPASGDIYSGKIAVAGG